MNISPSSNARKQILAASKYIQLSPETLEQIFVPDRILSSTLVLKKDNGEIVSFPCYRSQHNNARGPYKGGIRFHQNVSEDEVVALSIWMSMKTAVLDLPLGGGKGGIIVDPKKLSPREIEKLSRLYVQKFHRYFGPNTDVPAPDVNTNGTIMSHMVDEYARLSGEWMPGAFTGKPLGIGGSKGRDIATALGGVFVLEAYFKDNNGTIAGKKVIIEGAGNAGLTVASLLAERGAIIVGISDSQGGIYNAHGLNLEEIIQAKKNKQPVTEAKTGELVNQDVLLEMPCDILIPAALENRITEKNAANIQAKVILELANGPTTPEADDMLFKRGVDVLPDILANAGGVTVSYFEQVQNNTNYFWEKEEVFAKLEKKMHHATAEVLATAKEKQCHFRMASYIQALTRIGAAMELRSMGR